MIVEPGFSSIEHDMRPVSARSLGEEWQNVLEAEKIDDNPQVEEWIKQNKLGLEKLLRLYTAPDGQFSPNEVVLPPEYITLTVNILLQELGEAFSRAFDNQNLPDLEWHDWSTDSVMKNETPEEQDRTFAYYYDDGQKQKMVMRLNVVFDLIGNFQRLIALWNEGKRESADRFIRLIVTSIQMTKLSAVHEGKHHDQRLNNPDVYDEMIAVNQELSQKPTWENIHQYMGNRGEIEATTQSFFTLAAEQARIGVILQRPDLSPMLKEIFAKMYRVSQAVFPIFSQQLAKRKDNSQGRTG